MKKILLLSLVLSSCSLGKKRLDEVHVHLYNHHTCEWSCLFMKDTLIPKNELTMLPDNSIIIR